MTKVDTLARARILLVPSIAIVLLSGAFFLRYLATPFTGLVVNYPYPSLS